MEGEALPPRYINAEIQNGEVEIGCKKQAIANKRRILSEMELKKEAIKQLIDRNMRMKCGEDDQIHFPFVCIRTENTPENKVRW